MTIRLSAYYDSAQGASFGPTLMPADKYDEIVMFGAQLTAIGGVDVTTRLVSTYEADFLTKCSDNNVDPLLAIIQDGDASDITAATVPAVIDTTVSNLVSYAQSAGYAGFELDWENNIVESQMQSLMTKLREAWPTAILTAYFGVGERLKFIAIDDILDYLYVNTYDSYATDFTGADLTVAWHNAATRYEGAPFASRKSAEGALWYMQANGVDLTRRGMAVPSYGRILEDALVPQDPGDAITDTTGWLPNVTKTFQQIQDLATWANRAWDSVGEAPYIPDSLNVGYVTYSDAQHMKYLVALADEVDAVAIRLFTLHQEYLSGETGDAKYPMSTQLRASIDYDPPNLIDTSTLGDLSVSERTNHLRYGERPVITGAYWEDLTGLLSIKSGVLLDFGNPDGSTSIHHYGADDTSNTTHQVIQKYTGVANENIVISGYFHAAEESWVCLLAGDTNTASWSVRHWFNLSTGVLGASELAIGAGIYVDATIDQVGSVDVTGFAWYRCSLIVTPPTDETGFSARIITTDTDGVSSYAAGAAGDGIYLWGISAEEGSFPSLPVIETNATAVTRSTTTGLSGTRNTLSSPCTLAIEFSTGSGGIDTEVIWQLDDNSAGIDESIRIAREAGTLFVQIRAGGVEVADLNLGAVANGVTGQQVVVTCADGDFRASLNQGTAVTHNSGTAPVDMTHQRRGSDHTPANYQFGWTHAGRAWPSVELGYLTEWPTALDYGALLDTTALYPPVDYFWGNSR